jgi:DNA invertase Pin-like site-specific DNA recombinase
MHDASVKGRTFRGQPGAPPGEKHPNAKVSDADVVLMHVLRSKGVKQNVIAETFGISRAQVWRILNGRQRQTS